MTNRVHVQIVAALFTCGLVGSTHAQSQLLKEFSFLAIEFVHYELKENAGGVPLVGLITANATEGRVKFTTCANTTIEVERSKLAKSPARCRKREDPGPFTASSNSLIPVYKAEAGAVSTVLFEGRRVNLDGSLVPLESKKAFLSAKEGDLVGYAFTTQDGRKAIGLLKAE